MKRSDVESKESPPQLAVGRPRNPNATIRPLEFVRYDETLRLHVGKKDE